MLTFCVLGTRLGTICERTTDSLMGSEASISLPLKILPAVPLCIPPAVPLSSPILLDPYSGSVIRAADSGDPRACSRHQERPRRRLPPIATLDR